MVTPAHCDKSPLKEITLRTKEKQLLQVKEEGMPISIIIIACLECSCHIWVPQLVYFDKIHHVYNIQMHKATHFVVFGHKCDIILK
jgi:hypothetical protein